jgi:hypothetical protein
LGIPTVTAEEPETPSFAAVIVVDPAPTALASPFESIVTIAGLVDAHVTPLPLVMSPDVKSLYLPTAKNC